MSYEFREYLNKLRKDNNEQYVKEEYSKLDKNKKDELVKRVNNEIEQLKAKFIADQRRSQQNDEIKKSLQESNISGIKSGDQMFRLSPSDIILRPQSEINEQCECEEVVLKDISMDVHEMGESNVFDRVKGNFSQLRNDLDDLDQYDVRNISNNRRSQMEQEYYIF
jgi:hypothetical protein